MYIIPPAPPPAVIYQEPPPAQHKQRYVLERMSENRSTVTDGEGTVLYTTQGTTFFKPSIYLRDARTGLEILKAKMNNLMGLSFLILELPACKYIASVRAKLFAPNAYVSIDGVKTLKIKSDFSRYGMRITNLVRAEEGGPEIEVIPSMKNPPYTIIVPPGFSVPFMILLEAVIFSIYR